MDGKLVSVRNSRTSSTPWVITQDDKAVACHTPRGLAVMLFNNRELAELAIEHAKPPMPGAIPVQIYLESFAQAAINDGYPIATIDYYGNRFMGVLEFATVLEAIKRS